MNIELQVMIDKLADDIKVHTASKWTLAQKKMNRASLMKKVSTKQYLCIAWKPFHLSKKIRMKLFKRIIKQFQYLYNIYILAQIYLKNLDSEVFENSFNLMTLLLTVFNLVSSGCFLRIFRRVAPIGPLSPYLAQCVDVAGQVDIILSSTNSFDHQRQKKIAL